jgi:hypothetical protein
MIPVFDYKEFKNYFYLVNYLQSQDTLELVRRFS